MHRSIRWIFNRGNKADKFDGIEIKCIVMDPQNGTGNFVVKADDPQKYGSILHYGLKLK